MSYLATVWAVIVASLAAWWMVGDWRAAAIGLALGPPLLLVKATAEAIIARFDGQEEPTDDR